MRNFTNNNLPSMIKSLIKDEKNIIANLANISALIYMHTEKINWVGFYLSEPDNSLVLGPFQGAPACIRIPYGKGVCGTAAALGKTLIVDNVHEFDGHIACDARSNSEIVVPIKIGEKIFGVLDIDSPEFSRFNETDKELFEKIASIISQNLGALPQTPLL